MEKLIHNGYKYINIVGKHNKNVQKVYGGTIKL